ncbi:MAG: hypothetical protein GOV01_01665 [Candidatus Altiarchaeota archaeon]|nr:hypothetical protein [Candidatus Altiarchaeota archaeon]
MSKYIANKTRRELKIILINLFIGVALFFYGRYLGIEGWWILPWFIPIIYSLRIHLGILRRLVSGAYGEEEVIRELHKHLRDHRIFQNVYTGRGDIDVVVVGEGGVFVLEVKKLKYTVRAGKNSVKYGRKELLNQLERNEEYVRRLISREGLHTPITSYLVIFGKIKGRNSVIVKNTKDLIKKIRVRSVLTRSEVSQIATLFSR